VSAVPCVCQPNSASVSRTAPASAVQRQRQLHCGSVRRTALASVVESLCQPYGASVGCTVPASAVQRLHLHQPQLYRVSVNYDTSATFSATSAAIVTQHQQQLATIAASPPHATRSAPCSQPHTIARGRLSAAPLLVRPLHPSTHAQLQSPLAGQVLVQVQPISPPIFFVTKAR
jgi:hypothetical protein